jgi:hypothetical protein
MEARTFDLLGKSYEEYERQTGWIAPETRNVYVAICNEISKLKPETEWERDIFVRVIQFHRENLNDDALKRMYLTLSRTVPARTVEYYECLDAYVFFSNDDEHDDERDEALDRLHEVLTDRLAAQPAEQAAV